jgi:hypothetical protein
MKDLIYGFVRSGEYLPAIFLAGLPNNEEGDEMNYSSNEKSSYYVFPIIIFVATIFSAPSPYL